MLTNETPTQFYERMRQARRRYVRCGRSNGQTQAAQQRDAARKRQARMSAQAYFCEA